MQVATRSIDLYQDILTEYQSLLERKVIETPAFGFLLPIGDLNPILKEHQALIVRWAIEGGRRAIGASFGLGKTVMELEIAYHVKKYTGKSFLIGLPLGVKQEFEEDADLLKSGYSEEANRLGYSVFYVRDMAEVYEIEAVHGPSIFLSNYERIRVSKFIPKHFGGVSFDEGDIIRNLDTETTDYIMTSFNEVDFRFIATATPSPNDYTELLNYAQFLGIADRSQMLTRFFQRNSTTAGDLTIYPHKEKEFWYWIHSWAVIMQKPSDLGCSDEGYNIPEMEVNYHMVKVRDRGDIVDRRDNQSKAFRDTSKGLVEASKEKRESLPFRINKAVEIVNDNPEDHFILWHHLDDEYKALQKLVPGLKVVHGGQPADEREDIILGFKNGRYQHLATKPRISGSGCNFQKHCHRAIFVGINYEFKDFIQAIHRILRFMQKYKVVIDIIYSDAEEAILKTMLKKWNEHNEMMEKMSTIIRSCGLSDLKLVSELRRTIGVERKEQSGNNWQAIYNDCVVEALGMDDNVIDMIMTSIPFSDQYEYCESYNDMGHNDGNAAFFQQLGYLTPQLLRILKPGRICVIHVKDRIRFSYQNGQGFTSLVDFSGQTVAHFEKYGFHLLGKHVITTDVVMENNQTYRLGWTEQCKDATKMGAGSPEYLLVFRKSPSETTNAYADEPVTKSKEEYTRARWQLDAHAYWKSAGDRLINPDELKQLDLSQIGEIWKNFDTNNVYDFENHVAICEILDSQKKLPARFMAIPPRSTNPWVWDDISRMHTLNSKLAQRKMEKHVCPLQFDIIDRAVTRYSNKSDIVYDPFGGVMSVPYRCQFLDRKSIATELNELYWKMGVQFCKEGELKNKRVPTLFDLLGEGAA